MKNIFKFTSLLLLVIITVSFSIAINPELSIGSAIPKADVKMMSVKGKEVTLNATKKEKGLLVLFSCNTCPYVKLYENRINNAVALADKLGIGVILINSNEGQRNDEDSFEEMKKFALDKKITCNYVVDKNSELANAFGATRTPQCFLFDKAGLVYRGAIDDNVKDETAAQANYLKDALEDVASGKVVAVNSTKSVGCGIKRVEE
ncbi:MAG: thioredoxin family protein [Bacteroidia bacterium]